jgi:hypothetical protein
MPQPDGCHECAPEGGAADGASGADAGADEGGDGGGAPVRFVTGDFRASLPALLAREAAVPSEVRHRADSPSDWRLAQLPRPSQVAVVACHACGHLTDAMIDACICAGVDFAAMPCADHSSKCNQAAPHCRRARAMCRCCHRDDHTQKQMGLAAATLGTSEHKVIEHSTASRNEEALCYGPYAMICCATRSSTWRASG